MINKVYEGNCLTVLPSLPSASVDAVITDPPYSSGAATLTGKRAAVGTKYQSTGTMVTYPTFHGDAKDQRSYIRWAAEWLSDCWRIAKDGAPLLVFTDWRQLGALTDAVQMADWLYKGLVIWIKPTGRPQIGEFRKDAEFVIYATKGKRVPHSRQCLPGHYRHNSDPRKKHHLTGKPVALMADLLEIVPPGGLVLDPFLGGGSTAVACVETGRSFVGVEMSEEYCQITRERVMMAGGTPL